MAAEEVLFGPVPDWVVEQPVSSIERPVSEIPVRVVQLDTQIKLDPDSQTIFSALRLKFQSPQGLSAGNISLPWRSETDELTVHRLRILRADESIDVLAEGQTFTVLRREQNLELAMLTGVLTANMFPEGLEVGDVLDLAYSIETSHPVLKGHAEASFGPMNSPADQVSIRMLWPARSDIILRKSDDLPEWEEGRKDGYRTAQLSLQDVVPIDFPEGAPARFSMIRFAEASDYSTWSEVAQLFAPLYRAASLIPADGPLRNEVEKIRAATQDPGERAELALALVQDRIRYVALAMGAAGYVPADAATTWSRRFGDCKAKTALLIGILTELGIEAEPVAVHSVLGDTLPVRLPKVSAFDHILVRARIDGVTYFMDGTGSGDVSLELLTVPNFTWGLPIVEGQADLVAMVPAPLELPEDETTIHMDASAGLYAPVPTEMAQVLRGDTAQATLDSLNQLVGNSQRQALEDYWTGRFDFVTPEDVSFEHDREKGELRLKLTGQSELDWDGVWLEARGMRVGYDADFSRPEGPYSDAPFVVGHPYFNKMTQTIVLPPGFDADSIRGEEVEAVVAGVEYRRSIGLQDNLFTASRSTRSLVAEIPASEAREAEQRLTDLSKKRLHLRKPDTYRATAADIAAMGSTNSNDADALIEMAVDLLDAGQLDTSLKLLDRVNELEPQNQWGWANRAVVLARKRDFEGSEAATTRTERIAPDNYVMWHARAIAAEGQGRKDDALAAYGKAIELYKDNQWALAQRMRINYLAGRYEDSIADSRRIREFAPEDFNAYMSEANALLALGRKDESEALADAMAERFKDQPQALSDISIMYQQLEREDKAEAVIVSSLEAGESAAALTHRARMRDQGERKESIADLTRALELEPNYLPALLARADLYWLDYQLDLAVADADAAIALAPVAFPAYTTKAEVMIDRDRPAEAAKVADQLVAAAQNNAFALNSAIQIYMRVENSKKARETADRMVAAAPDDPFALAMAAQTYNQVGDPAKARELIEKAHDIAPEHPMVKSLYSYMIENRNPVLVRPDFSRSRK